MGLFRPTLKKFLVFLTFWIFRLCFRQAALFNAAFPLIYGHNNPVTIC